MTVEEPPPIIAIEHRNTICLRMPLPADDHGLGMLPVTLRLIAVAPTQLAFLAPDGIPGMTKDPKTV